VNFFLRYCFPIGSIAHSASYPMDTGGFLPAGEAAGAWSWPLISIQCRS